MGIGVVRIALIGDVPPQSETVADALYHINQRFLWWDGDPAVFEAYPPDLIIVAGYRRLIPPEVLAIPRLGTVGFHSAKLPEYPGRAPVPWTLLRGDTHAYNTMLFLDEGVDSGDIIDQECSALWPHATPEQVYEWIAESSVRMLLRHLPALKAGTAPRAPQDTTKRGPLTTKDGWARWLASRS